MRYDVNQYRFVTWDKKATDLYLIRASVDALARNIAKMQLEAVIYTDRERAEKKVDRTSDVARVLRHPNQYMTQYDFLYKVAAMFYTTNNVFIYPEYKDDRLIALHPINYEDFSIYETDKGTLIAKFRMNYYQTYSILYDDLIHLRNHFMTKDLIGDSNGDAIKPITELLTTQNQGSSMGSRTPLSFEAF